MNFKNGVIMRYESGPRIDKAYAVSGRAFLIYCQNGYADGKLGLPLSDLQRQLGDNYVQYFQKGYIKYNLATNKDEVKLY